MPYIDKAYVPTIWENEVTLVDSDRMNKLEAELVNHEYAESLRQGTLRTSVLPLASTNSGDAFTRDAIGAVQLTNSYEQISALINKPYAATPYAVNQAYLNSAAIDTKLPALRIAKESVIAQGLKSAITLQFTGGKITGESVLLQNSGSTLSFNLSVTDDSHGHSIKTITAPATSNTKGFVSLAQALNTISVEAHIDEVPTSKLFKDTITSIHKSIDSNANRIGVNEGVISKLKNFDASLSTDKLFVNISKGMAANDWVNTFTAEQGKLVSIENSIQENSNDITTLKAKVSALETKSLEFLVKADVDNLITVNNSLMTLATKGLIADSENDLKLLISELTRRVQVLEGKNNEPVGQ